MSVQQSRPGRRRADAERNIEAILGAAATCFGRDADASMTEIAKAAGVGRVTLYGHFPSREALLETLFDRSMAEADAALDSVDVDRGPAYDALTRLISSSWRILDRQRGLLTAALRHLGPDGVRERHAGVLDRVDRLIARGQDEGVFTTELPRPWLITTFFTLMHAAAQEVDEGRLDPDDATRVLTITLLNALA